MRIPPEQSLTAERSASAAIPQPLPRPEGDRRAQAALDADRHFRRSVLAAFIIAAAAGSGFGRLISMGTWTGTALWCLTIAGLAARCVRPRNGWRGGVVDVGASRRAGIVVALAVTRLSGIGFTFLVWRWPEDAPMVGAIAAAVVLVILDVLTSRRRSFAPIAAAVFVVHLGALPPSANLLGRELPLHIVAATLEFLLLSIAGVRYAQASLWRFPSATYRVAPLCIVPRLNRAWDHPVKINVV
ncbi:MAG TPA: hypothetical protein VGQ99_23520 [Tepidisphaeraceae bacterium]|jgi:hypothetical protein|nr:hypothetical protein [Tepidisphaeraceae bacterium]